MKLNSDKKFKGLGSAVLHPGQSWQSKVSEVHLDLLESQT